MTRSVQLQIECTHWHSSAVTLRRAASELLRELRVEAIHI